MIQVRQEYSGQSPEPKGPEGEAEIFVDYGDKNKERKPKSKMNKEFPPHGSYQLIVALILAAALCQIDMHFIDKLNSFGNETVFLFIGTSECITGSESSLFIYNPVAAN